MNFPKMIKTKREELRETQEQFAKRFNTHSNTVSRWETGLYQAPYEVIDFVLRDTTYFEECEVCKGTGYVKRERFIAR